jgi:trehalose/maltose transport system substrate-binding protein
VFQAKAYEGLSCDALEWVHSHGGGEIVDKDGNVTINNPKAARA